MKELIPKEMTASKFMHQDDKLLQVSNCQWVGKMPQVIPDDEDPVYEGSVGALQFGCNADVH